MRSLHVDHQVPRVRERGLARDAVEPFRLAAAATFAGAGGSAAAIVVVVVVVITGAAARCGIKSPAAAATLFTG